MKLRSGEAGARWLGLGLAESMAAWSVTMAMIAALMMWVAKEWIDRYEAALSHRKTTRLHATIIQGAVANWSRGARSVAASMAQIDGVDEAMRHGDANRLFDLLGSRFVLAPASINTQDVVITDARGGVLMSLQRPTHEFANGSLKIGTVAVTEVREVTTLEDASGLPVLVHPVLNEDGQPTGWLCLWADGTAILDRIAANLQAPCFVRNRDGAILATAGVISPSSELMLQWRPDVPTTARYGDTWYETYAIPCGDGSHVVIAHDVTSIAMAVRRGQAATAIMTGSLLIIIAMMIMLIVRFYLRPVRGLSRIMRQAAETGDFDVRVKVQGRSEIAAMASAFNTLARTITSQLKELAESRAVAESASRAKSDFLAKMSHEIRTPLTAIIGYAEVLKEESLATGRPSEPADVIHRNGENLLTIINDILDLSKIEAGKMDVERVETDVLAIVQDVHALMHVPAVGKSIDLRLDVRFPVPTAVMTDPLRLRQILVNLVSNAIKFTHCGDVTLHLRYEHTPTSMLVLEVADTGMGMSPSDAARCFEPFMQADSSMTRRFGGTGLGLPISRQLAELLGGVLRVESVMDRGSTFTLELPTQLAPGSVMRDSLTQRSAPQTTVSKSHGDRLHARILLAEDGADNQRLICFHLRRVGATVDVVADGAAAVEAATRDGAEPFDVILMDMQMPVMDGYTATARLRTLGYTGPIVAITAHAMTGDREQCLAAGCTDYLSKPVDFARLITVCQRLTNQKRTTMAA